MYLDSTATPRPNPSHSLITPAAYLLFYRRRTTPPATNLGGPFFDELLSSDQAASSSAPNSRQTSPSGEGRLVDSFSRNGSSSAFRGVAPAHRAGVGGGLEGVAPNGNNVEYDEELPEYEEHTSGLQVVKHHSAHAGGMDLDEGIGDMEDIGADADEQTHDRRGGGGGRSHYGPYQRDEPAWSFGPLGSNPEEDENDAFTASYPTGATGPSSMRISRPLTQQEALGPDTTGYEDEDEDLFDNGGNASIGRAPSIGSDAPGFMDASDDEGAPRRGQDIHFVGMGGVGTSGRSNSPADEGEEERIPLIVPETDLVSQGRQQEEEEEKVVDIRIDEGDGA